MSTYYWLFRLHIDFSSCEWWCKYIPPTVLFQYFMYGSRNGISIQYHFISHILWVPFYPVDIVFGCINFNYHIVQFVCLLYFCSWCLLFLIEGVIDKSSLSSFPQSFLLRCWYFLAFQFVFQQFGLHFVVTYWGRVQTHYFACA